MEYLTEEECAQVQQLGIVADTLINKYVTAPYTSFIFCKYINATYVVKLSFLFFYV